MKAEGSIMIIVAYSWINIAFVKELLSSHHLVVFLSDNKDCTIYRNIERK